MSSRIPYCLVLSGILAVAAVAQPSGYSAGPFQDGSPYSRLPDGSSALSSMFTATQYRGGATTLAGGGSANPFTGTSGYSIPLGSLTTRGRVAFPLGLDYVGNVRLSGRDDNQTSPTGWVGQGWSLDLPFIARNHKGTYFTGDDVFYADLGSLGKGQLVRGASGRFYLADNPFVVITPDSATNGAFAGQVESWTILTVDGNRYVFGDRNGVESPSERITYHTAGAVRVSPYSIANAAAAPLIYRWDLRYVADAEQLNHLFFDWQKTTVNLYGSGKNFTRESYLQRVRSVGVNSNEAERWDFALADKPADEYVAPHSTVPSVYPEPLATKYLTGIRVFHSGTESANFTLTYTLVGSGRYRKRLLNEVRSSSRLHPYTGTFVQAPIWKCNYDATAPYLLRGVLKPGGGKTDFEYVTASLGTDAQQPVYNDANNRLRDEAGTVVAFPNSTSWNNLSSCTERFCFLVAKDGDRVGGRIHVNVRANVGNYFDEGAVYRRSYTSASSTVASNWKWTAAGDYLLVYNANDKVVHVHEWDGVSWSLKTSADFGPVAGSGNPIAVHAARNYFVVTQAGNPLNKAWVYLRRGHGWVRLNAGTTCDLHNNTAYGETVKNTGYGCLEFNSTLKVAVSENFFVLLHDATDIFYAYALNRDGTGFQNISGAFLNFGESVQHATYANNWSQNVTQVIPGPDYLLVQSVNATHQRLDVIHHDGVNLRRVATSGWEGGVAADLTVAAEKDYFVSVNQNTRLLHLWRRTGITGGFIYTRTQVRTGVPARSAARLTLRAFPEAFAVEYGRLSDEIGGQPIPILEGTTDLSSWLYQVDPTATGGFRDRSTDIRYTVAGGTTKLFGLSITPDNLLGGVTLRSTATQSSVCPAGGTCTPFFATYKVRRGETGTPYATGAKAVAGLSGPSANRHVVFSAARSGMLSWFDGTAQAVKFRLFAFDGDDYDGGPANVPLVSKIIERSGVEQVAGAAPDIISTYGYDQAGAEFNAHLQLPQFPLVTARQVDAAGVDNGRTETRYDVDKTSNRRRGRTLRLNGTLRQVQTFNKAGNLIANAATAFRTGTGLVALADWPASVTLTRIDNTLTQDIRPNGSKMSRRVSYHNFNNVNGRAHFAKAFQDDVWGVTQTLFNGQGKVLQTIAFSVPYSTTLPNGPDLEAASPTAPLNTTQAVSSSRMEYDPVNPYYPLKTHVWRHDGALTDAQRQAGVEPAFDLNAGWYLANEVTRRNAQMQIEESRHHKSATSSLYSSMFYEGRKQLLAGTCANAKLENCALLLAENGDVSGLATADIPGRWRKKGVTFAANQVHTGRYAFKVTNDSGLIIHMPLQDVRADGFGFASSAWIYRPTGSSSRGLVVERRNAAHQIIGSHAAVLVPQDPYDWGSAADNRWERWEVRLNNAQLIAGGLFQPGVGDYLRVWVGTGTPGANTANAIYVDDIVCHPTNAAFNLTTYDYRGLETSVTDSRHKSSYPHPDFAGNVLGIGDERYRMFGQGAAHRVGEN